MEVPNSVPPPQLSPELILTNDAGSFGGEAAVVVVAEKKSRKLETKCCRHQTHFFPWERGGERVFAKSNNFDKNIYFLQSSLAHDGGANDPRQVDGKDSSPFP